MEIGYWRVVFGGCLKGNLIERNWFSRKMFYNVVNCLFGLAVKYFCIKKCIEDLNAF